MKNYGTLLIHRPQEADREAVSDTYLDLDLLDEQARDVLGMVRADELVIR